METVLEKARILDQLWSDMLDMFKSAVIDMFKELKGKIGVICHQIVDVSKVGIIKNFGVEKYSNWKEKFTRGTQQQIWADPRMNPWIWRQVHCDFPVWGKKKKE